MIKGIQSLSEGVVFYQTFLNPKGPNTSLEGVLGWFLGVKPLLRRYQGTLRERDFGGLDLRDFPGALGASGVLRRNARADALDLGSTYQVTPRSRGEERREVTHYFFLKVFF